MGTVNDGFCSCLSSFVSGKNSHAGAGIQGRFSIPSSALVPAGGLVTCRRNSYFRCVRWDLSMPAQSKLCCALTKVECVTSLAVLGLLCLTVFSSGARQRTRIYQTTDLSNNTRIAAAAILFAADHSDSLPNPGWGTVQQCWLYASNLPPGGSGSIVGFEAGYNAQLHWLTNGQLFPYVGDARTFKCPADRLDSSLAWQRNIYISSYAWNGAVCGFGAIAGAYKLSQFRPDAILEWENDESSPFHWNDGSLFPDEGISGRHGGESLVAQFGGSVGAVLVSSWYSTNLAGSSGQRGTSIPVSMLPNRLWCNPGSSSGRQ
jgi:hypothetical protein